MKNIFKLFAILFLSFLLACSEEPPTNINNESLSKKPVPPGPPAPLVLLENANQIVGCFGSLTVWTYGSGTYAKSWEKSGNYPLAAIGDVDSDGNDELVAVFVYETGNGRNKVTHTVIQIFENGDINPSRTSADFNEGGVNAFTYMRLGDANNAGAVEIMLTHMNFLSVHKDDGSATTILWKSEDLSAVDPFSIDAGDVDNDGQNEIIYAELGGQRFGVYEYLGNNNWGDKVYSETIPCGLDRAFVADVDEDGVNEVVGGGCASKLFVWEQINGNYVISFQSADLGGYTQGVAAGDFDDDGINEIAVGTAFTNDKVYVFKFNGTTYSIVFEESINGSVNDMFAGDSDNDGIDEIVIATDENLFVYDYNGTTYSQTYSSPGGFSHVVVK